MVDSEWIWYHGLDARELRRSLVSECSDLSFLSYVYFWLCQCCVFVFVSGVRVLRAFFGFRFLFLFVAFCGPHQLFEVAAFAAIQNV